MFWPRRAGQLAGAAAAIAPLVAGRGMPRLALRKRQQAERFKPGAVIHDDPGPKLVPDPLEQLWGSHDFTSEDPGGGLADSRGERDRARTRGRLG